MHARQPSLPAVGRPLRATVAFVRLIRQVRPHGPFVLLGLCIAAAIACEVAQQLRDAGEEVELLVLIEGWAPGYLRRRRAPARRPHLPLQTVDARSFPTPAGGLSAAPVFRTRTGVPFARPARQALPRCEPRLGGTVHRAVRLRKRPRRPSRAVPGSRRKPDGGSHQRAVTWCRSRNRRGAQWLKQLTRGLVCRERKAIPAPACSNIADRQTLRSIANSFQGMHAGGRLGRARS